MNPICFLLGHKKKVQEDQKTVVCTRCNKKVGFWKKGYAEMGISLERRYNGLLGFMTEPTNWITLIVLFIAFKLLMELK